jgi:hypothetical protein
MVKIPACIAIQISQIKRGTMTKKTHADQKLKPELINVTS